MFVLLVWVDSSLTYYCTHPIPTCPSITISSNVIRPEHCRPYYTHINKISAQIATHLGLARCDEIVILHSKMCQVCKLKCLPNA